MSKRVQGVGINDLPGESWVDGKKDPYYSRWTDMLKRCYSSSYHKNKPSYKDCWVCDEWLSFSKFKSWMIKQDWIDKHLDKDLIEKGNLKYSPETCVFVSNEVNQFLNMGGKSNGLLEGVTFIPDRDRYRAQIGRKKGNSGYIGSYITEIDAHNAYVSEKKKLAIEIASRQDDFVSKLLLERYK